MGYFVEIDPKIGEKGVSGYHKIPSDGKCQLGLEVSSFDTILG